MGHAAKAGAAHAKLPVAVGKDVQHLRSDGGVEWRYDRPGDIRHGRRVTAEVPLPHRRANAAAPECSPARGGRAGFTIQRSGHGESLLFVEVRQAGHLLLHWGDRCQAVDMRVMMPRLRLIGLAGDGEGMGLSELVIHQVLVTGEDANAVVGHRPAIVVAIVHPFELGLVRVGSHGPLHGLDRAARYDATVVIASDAGVDGRESKGVPALHWAGWNTAAAVRVRGADWCLPATP